MKNTITVYTTEHCGYCHMLKNYLNQNNIKYSEKRVDQDQQAAQEMFAKSGQRGVPFTIVNKDGQERGVLGFDVKSLQHAMLS